MIKIKHGSQFIILFEGEDGVHYKATCVMGDDSTAFVKSPVDHASDWGAFFVQNHLEGGPPRETEIWVEDVVSER